MTLALYPWELPALVADEDADIVAFHDEAHEAWLDDFLADLEQELAEPAQPAWLTDWLDDVATAIATVAAPGYVPFQHTEHCAQLADEIGYAESVTPFNF